MSLSDHETRELHELFEAVVEQTAGEQQSAKLARWLKESEEARRLYVRYLALSASLHHYAGLMQSEPVAGPASPERERPEGSGVRNALQRLIPFHPRIVLALCGGLLAALGVAVWFNGRPDGTSSSVPPSDPVVQAVVGEVEVESSGTTRSISGSAGLALGDRVRVPASALATVRYGDGTLVELRPDTVLQRVTANAEAGLAKVLRLERGTLFAEVQPQQQSMVVLTPTAQAKVMGTRFLLTANADQTRLEVQRGKVQLAPLADHQAVDVVGGHVAVATIVDANPALQLRRALPPSENLVENPGFEMGVRKTGKPLHWGGPMGPSLDPAVAHGGTTSLKVTGPAPFTYVWQSIALEPDTAYRLSVWIKTEGVSGKDGVRARYAQIEPKTIVWRSPPIRGTTDWVRWQTDFRTPADYCCGRLDLTWELNAGETAWFDDVELVKLDPAPKR